MTLDALVASRLCHDLVGPLGAIGNGLELLRMQADPSEELDLIDEAVKGAQARIDLFRLAFGLADVAQAVQVQTLLRAMEALGTARPIEIRHALDAPLPRPLARRLILAALCAESAMAWGGTLLVSPTAITAEAPRLRPLDALWQALRDRRIPETLDGASVHFGLLAREGVTSVEESPTRLVVTL